MSFLIGLLGAVILLGVAMFLGGDPGSFVSVQALLIVLGGSFFIALASYSLKGFFIVINVVSSAIFSAPASVQNVIRQLLNLSDFARKNGFLKLQGSSIKDLPVNSFLRQGLNMVVDGLDEKEVLESLQYECRVRLQKWHLSINFLNRLADVAPSMGLIGTLVGLVQLLSSMEDPSLIGPNMAIALLTTFYGTVLAHVFFYPLASYLEKVLKQEDIIYKLYIMGIASIGKRENPRRLEMLLNSAVPLEERVKIFG